MEKLEKKLKDLKHRREILKSYTIMKVMEFEDLHAAIDSLMDARDIDAELKIIEEIKAMIKVSSEPIAH